MEITVKTFLIVCPLVFLAGLMDAIAGGGGLISLPAYIMAGLPSHNAIATNKLSSCLGTAVSTFRLCKSSPPRLKLSVTAVALSFIGAQLGSRLSLLVNDSAFKIMMMICLPIVAFYVIKKKDLEAHDKEEISAKKQFIIVAIASFLLGTYDGFFGPGTGTFLIIAYTCFAKLSLIESSSITKLANLTSNASSLVVFLSQGLVIMSLGATAAIFSIAGHYIGSGLVVKNGTKIVRTVIIIALSLLFIKLILEFCGIKM